MSDDPLIARIGTFFVVLGTGLLILFVASDLAEQPDFDYLLIALALIGIGWLYRRKKAPPPASGRFSIFRRMREGSNQQRGGSKSKEGNKK